MPNRKKLGRAGELLAIKYLEGKGYKILEENWRDKHKEIDIIALDKDHLVFVEVKTRRSIYYGSPVEAVDMKKQKCLVDAAEDYIISNNITLEVRFDIIAIIMGNGKPSINHIKEAFHPAIG